MKLIDILVEELPKRGGWPEGAAFVAQEEGGGVWGFTSKPQRDCDYEWMDKSSRGYHKKVGELPEASDHDASTITREQYEAAMAAKNDGWIEWGGGECPVPGDTEVLIKCKSERAWDCHCKQRADEVSWTHDDSCLDVIAYRLHKPQQEEQPEVSEEDLNECIGQAPDSAWNGDGLIPPVGCECERSWADDEWLSCKILFTSNQIVVIKLKESGVEYAYNIGDVTFRPIRSKAERKRDIAVGAIFDVICKSLTDESESTSFAIYDAIAAGKIPGVKLEG